MWTSRKGGGRAIQSGHKTRNVDIRRESHRAWQTRGLEEEEDVEAEAEDEGKGHSQQFRGQGWAAGLLPACLPVGVICGRSCSDCRQPSQLHC